MFFSRKNNNIKNNLLASDFKETPYLLFLDFDGVLHPDYPSGIPKKYLFQSLPLLEEWLRKHPDVSVVLTTAWRQSNTLKKLREVFSDDIQCRIIGLTPVTKQGFDQYGRYYEIKMFLNECGWLNKKHYAILDDRKELFPEHCNELVLTDANAGMDEYHLQCISKILNIT